MISHTPPETIVTFAVRKVPQYRRHAHAYSLQVGTQRPGQSDPWTTRNDDLGRSVVRFLVK